MPFEHVQTLIGNLEPFLATWLWELVCAWEHMGTLRGDLETLWDPCVANLPLAPGNRTFFGNLTFARNSVGMCRVSVVLSWQA